MNRHSSHSAAARGGRTSFRLRRHVARRIGVIAMIGALSVSSGCSTQSHHSATLPQDHVFSHHAVAADHPLASEAGAEMLRMGGNAVDAAVAASFCLSVVRPYSCGIGGGGFMIITWPEGLTGASAMQAIAINYRETAPAAVGPTYYVDLKGGDAGGAATAGASRAGWHAAGIPGTVAGLLYALETYGTLDRADVLAPAIRAAERGFVADQSFVSAANELRKRLKDFPELRDDANYIWTQLCHHGQLAIGDTITNPEQARSLRLIAEHGAEVFYHGEIADAIDRAMREHGGPITRADLAHYAISVTEPLRGRFHDYEIIAMPPPSSGGIAMLQILGILDRLEFNAAHAPHGTADSIHLMTEAMKHAFADRAKWLADPAFVSMPVERLLSDAYLDERASAISRTSTKPVRSYGSTAPLPPDGGTSHLSVIDSNGMAVACTETINLVFGSLVTVPGYGIVLNDEMDDFTTTPGQPNAFGLTQSDRNLPQPGKRPLSSMSPTIVVEDGRVVLIAGASGGPRIITGTLQCLLNCLVYDMTPGESVAQPRFHHQWMPNVLEFEDHAADEMVKDALRTRGHEIGRRAEIGVVQLIRVMEDGLHAASDPRKGGMPAGE